MKRRAPTLILCLVLLIAGTLCGCEFPFASTPSPLPPAHLISESEAETDPVRAIDKREEKAVAGNTFRDRQLSLADVVASGFKPSFGADAADVKEVYEKAIAVLNRYILSTFTDYEKVHAIHDFIASSVEYDDALYEAYVSDPKSVDGSHDSFNLSGVLLGGKAVCDGISRAFAFLCGIEGITAVRIEGEYYGGGASQPHAWNKVKLGEKWYNVDVTADSARIDINGKTQNCLTHAFMLVSDSAIKSSPFGGHRVDPSYSANPVNEDAPEDYPVYESLEIDVGGQSFPALVTSTGELKALFKAVGKAGRKKIGKLDIRFMPDGIDPESPDAFDTCFKSAVSELRGMDFVFDPDSGLRPYVQYPRGVLLVLVYV